MESNINIEKDKYSLINVIESMLKNCFLIEEEKIKYVGENEIYTWFLSNENGYRVDIQTLNNSIIVYSGEFLSESEDVLNPAAFKDLIKKIENNVNKRGIFISDYSGNDSEIIFRVTQLVCTFDKTTLDMRDTLDKTKEYLVNIDRIRNSIETYLEIEQIMDAD